jgi:hypothetical protein
MVTIAFRLLCVLFVLSCLSACAPLVAMVGYGGSALQFAVTIDRVKLLGDGVSYLGSGKTITDHAVSMAVGADCRMLNVVSPKPLCAPEPAAVAAVANQRVTLAALNEELLKRDAADLPLPRTAGAGTAAADAPAMTDEQARESEAPGEIRPQ